MERIDFQLSERLFEDFEEFRKKRGFSSRSEAVRAALRGMMSGHKAYD